MIDFDALVLGAVMPALGTPATYTPPEGGEDDTVPCTVVLNLADDVSEVGPSARFKTVSPRRMLDVRASEVTPAKGGTFAVGADTLTVIQRPHRADPSALVWTCLCDIAAS